MCKAIATIVERDRSWNSPYHKYVKVCQKALQKKHWQPTEQEVIEICHQLKEQLDIEVADTTEKTVAAKNTDTTEKSYTQLTLSFPVTTEKPSTAPLDDEKLSCTGEYPLVAASAW